MIQELKLAVLDVLASLTPRRSLIASLINIDFKIGDEKTEFMKLCFSPLAAWSLFVMLALIYVDPTKNLWSLQRLLQDSYLITFQLLDGRLVNAAYFLFAFLLLERIFKNEYALIAVAFYFLGKSDLHFHLALAAVTGIFLGNALNLWSLQKTLVSATAKIWGAVAALHLLAALISFAITVYALEILATVGFFSESITVNRREFFIYAVLLNYFLQFVLLATWGHFRKAKKIEPADFPTNYSSSTWFGKIKLQRRQVADLLVQIAAKTLLHQNNLAELTAIKDLSPVSIPAKIGKILQAELQFLKLASSRLTTK